MIFTLIYLSVSILFGVDTDTTYQFVERNYYNNSERVVEWYAPKMDIDISVDSTAWLYTNIIRSHYYQGRYNEGIGIFNNKVKPLLDSITDKNTLYNAKALYSQLLHLNEDYQVADSSFKETIELIDVGYDSVKSSAYINYSVLAWEMGEYKKYKTLTDSAYKYAVKAGDLRRQRITLLHLSEYHEKITYDFEASKQYLDEASGLYLNDEAQKESIIRLKIRKAEYLRDVEGDYKEAINMFRITKSEAASLGYFEMQQMANVGFMRSEYLYDRYQEKRFRNMIVLIVVGLILTLALTYYTRRTRKVTSDYKKQFENRIDNI